MTNPADLASAATADLFALLRRARAVRDEAKIRCIAILPRQCAALAAADPADAESLADAVQEAHHVVLLAAAHPGCAIRPDGSVVPEGAAWEARDGEGGSWSLDEAPVTCTARRALRVAMADVKASAEAPQMGQKTAFWDVSVRLQIVGAAGFVEVLDEEGVLEIGPDEPECQQGEEHVWRSPWSVLGGDKKNPGVWGCGAGVIEKDCCGKCGKYRTINSGDYRPDNGEPCTTLRYEEADEASAEWAAEWAAEDD
jgi:hypothetical protein